MFVIIVSVLISIKMGRGLIIIIYLTNTILVLFFEIFVTGICRNLPLK